jgi:uncharacterized membrane protein
VIAVIGIDIGKSSLQIVGHDQRGAIVLRQKWSRGQVETRLLQLVAFLSVPAVRFRVVPKRAMHRRAQAEAMRQFLAQGLHFTEGRTGVLIFASVAERYAEIVADSGINARLDRTSGRRPSR